MTASSSKNDVLRLAILGAGPAGVGAAYMLTRRLWLCIGIHIAWNFTQAGIFSSVVSGNIDLPGVIKAKIIGPALLTGGEFGVERGPQLRRPADQLASGVVGHVAKVLLRLDDGVEIAAIGDIDLDRPDLRAVDLQPFRMQETGDRKSVV